MAVSFHRAAGLAARHPRTIRRPSLTHTGLLAVSIAACMLLGATGCSDSGAGPIGPALVNHALSPSVTSTTTHSGTVDGLNAQIATDDLIAGLIATELEGDLGWHYLNTAEGDRLPALTDGAGALSNFTGLMVDEPGIGTPTKRIRYELADASDVYEIRVLTGQAAVSAGDGRVFSTLVVRYSTDGGATYHLLGYFQSDPSGTDNPRLWQATLLAIRDSQSSILLAGVTHLEFEFFAAARGTIAMDPFEGTNPYTGVDDYHLHALYSSQLWEIDVIGEPVIPENTLPTAVAGGDQSVESEAWVSLDGSQSSDPEADQLSYAWTQTSGPLVVISNADQAVASFTAPVGPASLAFELTVCDPEPLCDTDAVTVTVAAPSTDVLDLGVEVSVNGPVKSNGTSKDFVVIVTNTGTVPATVSAQDIASAVSAGGQVIGAVSSEDGSKTLAPGRSNRFRLTWSYPAGSFERGADLEFQACVGVADDADAANDCSVVTVTAK
jgi:hypothetical protein